MQSLKLKGTLKRITEGVPQRSKMAPTCTLQHSLFWNPRRMVGANYCHRFTRRHSGCVSKVIFTVAKDSWHSLFGNPTRVVGANYCHRFIFRNSECVSKVIYTVAKDSWHSLLGIQQRWLVPITATDSSVEIQNV